MLVHDVDARDFLDEVTGLLADSSEFAMPVGIRLAGLDTFTAQDRRALGQNNYRVVAGTCSPVCCCKLGQLIDVEWDLGDDRTVRRSEVSSYQARRARVPAEQPRSACC